MAMPKSTDTMRRNQQACWLAKQGVAGGGSANVSDGGRVRGNGGDDAGDGFLELELGGGILS
jgi:hypothetical protein